jgi:hypothetical protein
MIVRKIALGLILIILAFFSPNVTAQKQIVYDGITLPRTIDFEGQELQLNGFGSRSKLWTEVYIQALYISFLSDNANEILNSDATMAIRLQITSSLVTSKKLSKSLQKGIIKSIGEENLSKFTVQLDLLEKLLNREDTNNGDNFNLIYTPLDKSIWVYKNNILEGKIPGLEFKKAFFGIWLGQNPVDDDLKKSLLGH